MQTSFLAASFAVLSIVLSPAPYASAQDAKVVRGTVTSIGGNSITVKVQDREMKFAVDAKTSIEAPGAGTKNRAAIAAGKPGPTLADVVKAGQPVAVTYFEMDGALRASKVRAIGNPSSGSDAAPAAHLSSGLVKEIGDRLITISGTSGGGATFTQTFAIDERTHVLAKGAGTATHANGGHVPFNRLVASGDRVTITYEKVGNVLYASDVHVTTRAAH